MNLRFLYRGLKTQLRDQKYECKALQKFLNQNDIALDIGSNKGSYIWTLSRATSHGHVIAFEPQPLLYNYLKNQTNSRIFRNVTVEPVALSSLSSTANLYIPKDSQISPSASLEKNSNAKNLEFYEIQTTALDDYCEKIKESRHIGAMKIDVEGHELSVLEGAAQTIDKNRPLIVCESESRHLPKGNVMEVLDYFRSINYSGYFIHPRQGYLDLSYFDPNIHQAQNGERFWDKKDYCNNFVFFHRDFSIKF